MSQKTLFFLFAVLLQTCWSLPTHGGPKLTPAQAARKLVHKSNWASFGTISSEKVIEGYPMVNVISIADSGKNEPSTGHIYFYLMDLDFTGKDWQVNNKVTLMMTDEQTQGCSKKNVNPMSPSCPRVILSGKVVKLETCSKAAEIGAKAFLSRHPNSANWVNSPHSFYLASLDIEHIYLLSNHKIQELKPEVYFKAASE